MQKASSVRRRVAVLFGGRNTEHQISCGSARSVLRFLDRDRYDVTPVLIARDGRWSVDGVPAVGSSVAESIGAALRHLRSVDVVLPCLHGPYGEDGALQALLDGAGIRYVGSGVLASAACMDKEFTKKIVAAEGIAVADGVVLRAGDTDVAPAVRARLGLPVFVKPARSGSSVGVTRVDDWGHLAAAIAVARTCDAKVLVEAAVVGREVDVALLERPGGEILAGPPLEIEVGDGASFFDFDAKYRAGAARFVIPADLEAGSSALLTATAHRVFTALGCAGLLRADFFLREVDGRVEPVLNEVNSMPGLTELSQFPQIWAAAGLAYPQLLDTLLSTALAKSPGLAPCR